MTNSIKHYSAVVILGLFLVASAIFYATNAQAAPAVRDENNVPAVLGSSCDSASVGSVVVGNQQATTLQGTTTRRALYRIQQPVNATNTLSIALNGTAAVSGSGLVLQATSSAEFGLTTTFPYTGPISIITNAGSSTVMVSLCTY